MGALRKTMTAVAAAILMLTGVAVTATPASAAELPICNDYTRLGVPNRPTLDQGQSVPTLGFGTRNFNCKLQFGSTGPGVLVLQVNLYYCYNQLDVRFDAIYGSVTQQAVRNAQLWERNRQNDPSIVVDGVFGPITSSEILWRATNSAGRQLGCDRRYTW